jgi:2-C-methyl-D-erythritol 4-phosphate cytidylyltransferase
VKIIEGEETNLKVTTPVDLRVAEFILAEALEKQ